VRRALLLLALGGVLTAASAASAAAVAGECRGLQTCVPIAGPWVRIPARAGTVSSVDYLVACPRGHVAGGTDALVADPMIDVSFRGAPGSPVAPGVTTERSVLFTGTYGGTGRAPTSFRPLVGCVPSSGGGGRSQTIHVGRRLAAVRPGRPIVREVLTVSLVRGRTRIVTVTCRSGGRLLGASHAVGFRQRAEPSADVLGSVSASHAVSGDRVVARGRLFSSAPGGTRALLQLHALCTRVGR
jgi:hypothetical protein